MLTFPQGRARCRLLENKNLVANRVAWVMLEVVLSTFYPKIHLSKSKV